jgi:hypothetical protein
MAERERRTGFIECEPVDGKLLGLYLLIRGLRQSFGQPFVIEREFSGAFFSINKNEFPFAFRQIVPIPKPGIVLEPVRTHSIFEYLIGDRFVQIEGALIIGEGALGYNVLSDKEKSQEHGDIDR